MGRVARSTLRKAARRVLEWQDYERMWPKRQEEPVEPVSVIVVDDKRSDREGLAENIRMSGYCVRAFDSAIKVTEFLRRSLTSSHIVFTDIHMPGYNGIQLLELIRRAPPYTLRVCMSGDHEALEEARQQRSGAQRYLPKPLDMEDVRLTLDELAEAIRDHDERARDELTKLPRKAYIFEKIVGELRHAQRFNTITTLLFIDGNGIHDLNRNIDMEAGSAAIQGIADCLKDSMRAAKDTLARPGGDEFLLLLPEADERVARAVTLRALRRMERNPVKYEGHIIPVSAAIGAATIRPKNIGPDIEAAAWRLIRRADKAMRKAKGVNSRDSR